MKVSGLAGQDEMKDNTGIILHGLWRNLPAILTMCTVGLYINNTVLISQAKTEALAESVKNMQALVEPVSIIQHRIDRAEAAINATNVRVDGLSNTMINNIDLIRRDVNRLTTQVEVLSSQIGMVLGDEKIPVQRRSRPVGPIKVD